jgi:hypothetical protein
MPTIPSQLSPSKTESAKSKSESKKPSKESAKLSPSASQEELQSTKSEEVSENGKAAKKGKKKKLPLKPREIIYPKLKTKVMDPASELDGARAMTAEDCKKLLGWQEEVGEIKFGNDYLFIDKREKKIFCTNNVTNRPLYMSSVETLIGEHLHKRWRTNGEPIIIGKTGLVLNGQHQLISLILANQIWEDAGGPRKDNKYHEYWKTPPTMTKLIVFGIEETDEVVNTMDTCKPRSLADVIYRSEYFKTMDKNDRLKVSKITEYAVKMLWARTGAYLDAFSPKRTHAESLDFIARHPRLLMCVKHVYEEDGNDGKIKRFLSPGYSAAYLYLMGSAATERENDDKTGYSQVAHPSEALLDWSLWDKACEFFVMLAAGHKIMEPIRGALGELFQGKGCGGNSEERQALLAKAWACWQDTGKVDPTDLELQYVQGEDGNMVLDECPTVGGIDLGRPKE